MSIKSDAEIIRDETLALANTALRVGGNLVAIANDLIAKQTAIDLNTAKVSYTEALVSANTDVVANTAKETYTEAKVTANTSVSANTAKVGYTDGLVSANTDVTANTAKVGISTAQANEIVANNSKVGYTETLVSNNTDVVANTAKVGITTAQANEIIANNAKDGITTAQENEIIANNAKISYTDASDVAANTAKLTANTSNVQSAGALMDSELASISDVKALNQSVISGANPTFGIANTTLIDTDLKVSKSTNLQTFADGVDDALLKARGTGVSATYVSSVVIGGTTFAQGAVVGEINGDQGYFAINYAGATGVTVSDLNSASTFVYINNAGVLSQQTAEPTREDFVRKVFTMRIAVDTVANTILGFEYLNNPIGHYANSLRDIYTFLLAAGVPFKKDQVVTGRAGDLGFNVSAGSFLEFGGTGDIYNPNTPVIDEVSNATFFISTRTAFDAGGNTDLPKFWDNNGTLTALGSTTLVAHRLYRFSNGNLCLQYGQGNYANMSLAKTGARLEEYVLNPALKNATFFGWWIIESTATNTGGTTLTDFIEYNIGTQGGSSNSLSGCLLKGNNLSDLLDVPTARTNLESVGSTLTNEPTGADKVLNIVSLTQAEYDAGTKVATTFYAING
jgi:hypothetical protein